MRDGTRSPRSRVGFLSDCRQVPVGSVSAPPHTLPSRDWQTAEGHDMTTTHGRRRAGRPPRTSRISKTTRSRGPDKLLGSNNPGPGHAGRRRMATLAMHAIHAVRCAFALIRVVMGFGTRMACSAVRIVGYTLVDYVLTPPWLALKRLARKDSLRMLLWNTRIVPRTQWMAAALGSVRQGMVATTVFSRQEARIAPNRPRATKRCACTASRQHPRAASAVSPLGPRGPTSVESSR